MSNYNNWNLWSTFSLSPHNSNCKVATLSSEGLSFVVRDKNGCSDKMQYLYILAYLILTTPENSTNYFLYGLNNAYVDFIKADPWGMQLIKFFMGFFPGACPQ